MLTATAFGTRLKTRFERKRTSDGNVYLGITLRGDRQGAMS